MFLSHLFSLIFFGCKSNKAKDCFLPSDVFWLKKTWIYRIHHILPIYWYVKCFLSSLQHLFLNCKSCPTQCPSWKQFSVPHKCLRTMPPSTHSYRTARRPALVGRPALPFFFVVPELVPFLKKNFKSYPKRCIFWVLFEMVSTNVEFNYEMHLLL